MREALRALLGSPFMEYLPGWTKALLRARLNPPVFPILLQIEPTRRCNLACQMCGRTHEPQQSYPDLTLGFFKQVVSQFPPELEAVHIQGVGEPLLNADIIEMIAFARSRGLRTSFNTNLTYLTDEMARRLVEVGHSEIIVSVESVDPELYAELRCNATLDRVLGNIRKLKEEKERQNSEFPVIKAHAILMKHLLPGVPDLVRTFREMGLVNVHFIDFITRGVSEEVRLSNGERLVDMALNATMTEEEIRQAIAEIKALGDDTFSVSVPGDWGGLHLGHKQGQGILTCKELWERPYVMVDGQISPCCFTPRPCLGDFHRQTFDEIWSGEAYERIRRQHLTNRHPRVCANCQQLLYTFESPSLLCGKHEPQFRYTRAFIGGIFGRQLGQIMRAAGKVYGTGRAAVERMRSAGWRSGTMVLANRGRDIQTMAFTRLGLKRVQCPLCDWQGFAFLSLERDGEFLGNEVCPHCVSHSVDRLFGSYALRREPPLLAQRGKLLHVSPETSLRRLVQRTGNLQYASVDRIPGNTEAGDSSTEEAPADHPCAYDIVLCLRPGFEERLAEIHRVLKPGGALYAAVPSGSGAAESVLEQWRALSPSETPERIDARTFLSEKEVRKYRVPVEGATVYRLVKA